MKKAKLFLLVLLASSAAIISFTLLSNSQKLQEQSPTKQDGGSNQQELQAISVKVVVDFGDGKVLDSAWGTKLQPNQTLTAYEVLEKFAQGNDLAVKTTKYDFGIFVNAINDYESGAEMSWIYFVNGQSGQVAADQAQLQDGDLVEWKYLKPTEE